MEPLLCQDPVAMRRRKGNAPLLPTMPPMDDEEELRLIMQEIADALGAIVIVLTIQEDDQAQNTILRVVDNTLGEAMVADLQKSNAFHYVESTNDGHRWKQLTIAGIALDIMILPVKRTPGHRRMVLSALFMDLDKATRIAAERVYLTRRPFAVGYFRLWQIDRTRESREQALEAAFNSLGVGFVLIDRDASTVFVNAVAQEIFASGNGLRLDGNRIHATQLADAVRLRTALDHAITPGMSEAPMLAINRVSAPPLTILVLPIEWGKSEIECAAAAIYIVDPAANVSSVFEPLCQIYQLTPSETRLACLLAAGKSLGECAEKMRIKEQTGRGVLKQIFRKTGTARQGELVKLLYSSVVRVRNVTRIAVVNE